MYDLGDLELYGGERYPIGVLFCAPIELKSRVLAAHASFLGGYRSIDYVLKRYQKAWNLQEADSEKKAFFIYLDEIKKEVNNVSSLFSNGIDRPENIGLMAAETSLMRSKASFDATLLLIKQNYVFEAFALSRLIFEQISWAFCANSLSDEDQILNLVPTKCISSLKEIIPNAGRIYGYLNEYTHLNPKHHNMYLGVENSRYYVQFRLPEHNEFATFFLMLITDIYRIVGEMISFDFIEKPSACKKMANGEVHIIEDRPFNRIIDQFQGKYFPDTEQS